MLLLLLRVKQAILTIQKAIKVLQFKVAAWAISANSVNEPLLIGICRIACEMPQKQKQKNPSKQWFKNSL